jgi:hypothetical protein
MDGSPEFETMFEFFSCPYIIIFLSCTCFMMLTTRAHKIIIFVCSSPAFSLLSTTSVTPGGTVNDFS